MGLSKRKQSWTFVTAAPPREVYAVMEQMLGTPPFRFEPVGPDEARIVEFERKGLFGQWSRRTPRTRWVRVTTAPEEFGTRCMVEASAGRGAVERALQLVLLLTRGLRDKRTIYRQRVIPPGPVSLVASWAGMGYPLLMEPRHDAPRGPAIHTATPVTAIGLEGAFVKVRTADGVEGYVDRDQVVAAPSEATREAQPRVARVN